MTPFPMAGRLSGHDDQSQEMAMRIYFKTLGRPKRVARTLQDTFPLEKLSQCQAWAAQIYGYRDWHEMEQVTASGNHAPSPDDEDLSETERRERQLVLSIAADEVLGLGLADSVFVVPGLNLTSRKSVAPAKRAGGAPKGTNSFYKLIQTDLLGGPGSRTGNASVSDEYYAYASVPERYGQESDYRTKLVKLLKRNANPYPGFANDCKQLLEQCCPQDTSISWEFVGTDDETCLMAQWEQQRIYIFDLDDNPVGFLELSQTLRAADHQEINNRVEMMIHEAWALEDAKWLLAAIAASHFSGTIAKLAIAWRAEQPVTIDLEIISDSEHLFSIDFLADVAEQAAEELGIDSAAIEVSYDI